MRARAAVPFLRLGRGEEFDREVRRRIRHVAIRQRHAWRRLEFRGTIAAQAPDGTPRVRATLHSIAGTTVHAHRVAFRDDPPKSAA